MNKKYSIRFIFTLVCILLMSNKENFLLSNEPKTDLINVTNRDDQKVTSKFKINIRDYYKKYRDKNNVYFVILYGKDKKIVEKSDYPKEPFIRIIDSRYIGVGISTGNPANYTFFYDIQTEKISIAYENYLLCKNGKIVYMDDGKLIISDIFDKKVFYKKIIRNFSAGLSVSNVSFIKPNKIKFTYLEGDEYVEKTEVVCMDGLY